MKVKFFDDGIYYYDGICHGFSIEREITIIYDNTSKYHMSECFLEKDNGYYDYITLIQNGDQTVKFVNGEHGEFDVEKKMLNISFQFNVFEKTNILKYQEENKIKIGDIVYKHYIVVDSYNLLYRTYYKLTNLENQDLTHHLLYCNINKCFYGAYDSDQESFNSEGFFIKNLASYFFGTRRNKKSNLLYFSINSHVIRSE